MKNLPIEAMILTKYLIGEIPNDLATNLYVRHVDQLARPLGHYQNIFWSLLMKLNWLLPWADSILGIVNKYHPIRHRIYIMNCILETQPEFSQYFLPRGKS